MKRIIEICSEHLWIKVMGVLVALLVGVFMIVIAGNLHNQTTLIEQTAHKQNAVLVDAIEGGMFDALAIGDNDTVIRQFARLQEKTAGLEVDVFDFNGQIAFSTNSKRIGASVKDGFSEPANLKAIEIVLGKGSKTSEPVMVKQGQTAMLSTTRAILNEQRCYHCHGSSRQVLGGIQVRSSMEAVLAGISYSRNINILLGLAGVLVLSVAIFFLFHRMVNQPIKRLLELAGKMRKGDLSHRLEVVGRDEISHVTARMNLVNQSLQTMIEEIGDSAHSLSRLSTDQAASVEETGASLEEMAAQINQNADNAEQADMLMKETGAVVQKADQGMRRLTTAMTEISQSSNEISNIVGTIDAIAFQTNLLALNAAVEAARAGEAGAGFAVVADEVRNLAIRSAKAAQNTTELIEATVTKIEGGAKLVTDTNASFAKVSSQTTQVGTLIDEIATASQQQSEGINQINQAISEIDKGIQNTAGNAEELSAATGSFKTNHQALIAPEHGKASAGAATEEQASISEYTKSTISGRTLVNP